MVGGRSEEGRGRVLDTFTELLYQPPAAVYLETNKTSLLLKPLFYFCYIQLNLVQMKTMTLQNLLKLQAGTWGHF